MLGEEETCKAALRALNAFAPTSDLIIIRIHTKIPKRQHVLHYKSFQKHFDIFKSYYLLKLNK